MSDVKIANSGEKILSFVYYCLVYAYNIVLRQIGTVLAGKGGEMEMSEKMTIEETINGLQSMIQSKKFIEHDFDGVVDEDVCERAIELLKEQEPKRGRWERLTGMAPPEYHGHKICSVCGCLAPYDPIHPWHEELSRYCPGCEAKMKGEAE